MTGYLCIVVGQEPCAAGCEERLWGRYMCCTGKGGNVRRGEWSEIGKQIHQNVKNIKIWMARVRNRTCGWRRERSRGLMSMWPLECDPPIETNRFSRQGPSSGFVPFPDVELTAFDWCALFRRKKKKILKNRFCWRKRRGKDKVVRDFHFLWWCCFFIWWSLSCFSVFFLDTVLDSEASVIKVNYPHPTSFCYCCLLLLLLLLLTLSLFLCVCYVLFLFLSFRKQKPHPFASFLFSYIMVVNKCFLWVQVPLAPISFPLSSFASLSSPLIGKPHWYSTLFLFLSSFPSPSWLSPVNTQPFPLSSFPLFSFGCFHSFIVFPLLGPVPFYDPFPEICAQYSWSFLQRNAFTLWCGGKLEWLQLWTWSSQLWSNLSSYK